MTERIACFAYGSNMDKDRLVGRVGPVIHSGSATLIDWQFRINGRGVATIVPATASLVYGVVWQLDQQQIQWLDDCEGVVGGLYRQEQVMVRLDGRLLSALVYVAAESSVGTPRSGYLELIIAAASRWAFPAEYVEELCTWTAR